MDTIKFKILTQTLGGNEINSTIKRQIQDEELFSSEVLLLRGHIKLKEGMIAVRKWEEKKRQSHQHRNELISRSVT